MRFEQLTLTDICKVGLSKSDVAGNTLGLAMLKNMRTDGNLLQACPIESTTKLANCIPFTLGLNNFYIVPSIGIYNAAGTLLFSRNFGTQRIKVINLIKVVWIQDDTTTIYFDGTSIGTVNPSGYDTPVANAMTTMNGQIVAAGLLSSSVLGHETLDAGYIAWTGIGTDNFSLTKQNESGIAHPDIGTVYDVLPMPKIDCFILLGSRGNSLMYYVEHIFGFKPIDIPLIKSEGLSASSNSRSVYISQCGDIIAVKGDGTPENLGYGWIGRDVIDVKYLRGRNVFVFTTSDNSYLLDDQGMYSYGYRVWGEFNSTLVVDVSFEQVSWGWRTTFWDAQRSGIKNMMEMDVRDGLTTSSRTVYAYADGSEIALGTKTLGNKTLNSVDAVKYVLAGQNISIGYASADAPTISAIHAQIIPLDRRFGNANLLYQNKW